MLGRRGVREDGAQRGDVRLQRPGGGDDLHRRARRLQRRVGDARRAPAPRPVRGFMTTMPPYWPPSAATAARSIPGEIVVLTGLAATGTAVASMRWPASSCPPGGARQLVLEDELQPVEPDMGVGGVAARRVLPSGRTGSGPTVPTIWSATSGMGELRSGPWASGVPSLASSVPRGGSEITRCSFSPLRNPGEQQRVGVVHPGAGARSGERHLKRLMQRAPQLGRDDHRHRDVVAVAAGDVHAAHRFLGRDVGGGLQPSGEPALAHLALGDAVEQRVHLGVILVMPRGDVARHHLALLVARAHGQEHPAHERRHREHGDGQGPCEQALPPSPPFPGPRSTRHDHPALCHLQTQGRQCAARIDRSGRLFARLQGRLSGPSPTTLSR